MKLKALVILEQIISDYQTRYILNRKKQIKEAIAELKQLNGDCKQCKHYLSENGNFPLEPCGECSLFYSNKWECKE